MARSTLTGKRAQEATDLFEQGFGCNAIARKMSIDPATVSHWAADAGLLFDRSQTAMAVRAHTIDLAADRLALAQMMHINAVDSLTMLDRPFEVFAFGGKENDFNSQILDSAPMEARRSAQMIAGVAFDKATRVVEKTSPGLDEAVGMLDTLADGFAAAAAALRAETPTDGE